MGVVREVRGEGAGVILLKPLSAALVDGDLVYAVVLGTAVNQDGHTNGMTVPSPEAQMEVVRAACRDAGHRRRHGPPRRRGRHGLRDPPHRRRQHPPGPRPR